MNVVLIFDQTTDYFLAKQVELACFLNLCSGNCGNLLYFGGFVFRKGYYKYSETCFNHVVWSKTYVTPPLNTV